MKKIDFAQIGNSFKSLDPKDMPNWPWPPKVMMLFCMFLLTLGLGYYFLVADTIETLDAAQSQEVKLKEEFVTLKKQGVNLALYKQQLVDIEKIFGDLLKQLPNKSEVDSLLVDINRAGVGRGLSVDYFKPGTEKQADFYAELPVNLKLSGAFADMAGFANDIAMLSRIVVLSDVNMVSNQANQVISMEATARTFRYLDEAEIAMKRQQEAEKKKKAGAGAGAAKKAPPAAPAKGGK